MKQLTYLFLMAFICVVTINISSAQPIIKATIKNDVKKLQKIISKKPEKVNTETDKNGNTALILAVILQREPLANLLLSYGANVNLQNKKGSTPLIEAVKSDQLNLCQLLIKKNPDILKKDFYGKTALEYIRSKEVGWTVGTESFLLSYIISVKDLRRFQGKFPKSVYLSEQANQLLEKTSDFPTLKELGNLNILPEWTVERKASNLVNTYKKWLEYYDIFGTGIYSDFALINIKDLLPQAQIIKAIEMSPDCSPKTREALGQAYLSKVRSLDNGLQSLSYFPEQKDAIEYKCQQFVRTLQDVKDFVRVFPNTTYDSEIIERTTSNLSGKLRINRSTVFELIGIFPNSKSADLLKQLYIQNSTKLSEFLSAIKQFPGIIQQPEEVAMDYIKSLNDAKQLIGHFGPKSLFKSTYLELLSRSREQKDIYELNDLFEYLPKDILEYGILQSIGLNETLEDCYYQWKDFPLYRPKIIDRAFNLLNSVEDCKTFMSYFPTSSIAQKVKEKSRIFLKQEYNSCGSNPNCYRNFISKHISEKTYDPDQLIAKARKRANDLQSMVTFTDAVGVEMVKRCSWTGAQSIDATFNEAGIFKDDNLKHTIIPMTVQWVSAANGKDYWVVGKVYIQQSGTSGWLPEKNSRGIVPGCTLNVVFK